MTQAQWIDLLPWIWVGLTFFVSFSFFLTALDYLFIKGRHHG